MDQPRAMFPILKPSTILQIMEEVNVPLKESELAEPGRCKERVREVFVQLVSNVIYCSCFVICYMYGIIGIIMAYIMLVVGC